MAKTITTVTTTTDDGEHIEESVEELFSKVIQKQDEINGYLIQIMNKLQGGLTNHGQQVTSQPDGVEETFEPETTGEVEGISKPETENQDGEG